MQNFIQNAYYIFICFIYYYVCSTIIFHFYCRLDHLFYELPIAIPEKFSCNERKYYADSFGWCVFSLLVCGCMYVNTYMVCVLSLSVWVYVCKYIYCIYIYMYIYIQTIYIYIYIYIEYIYIYIYIYTYIYTFITYRIKDGFTNAFQNLYDYKGIYIYIHILHIYIYMTII